MRILAFTSEADMVATFLRGELTSERFATELLTYLQQEGVAPAQIEHPDLTDALANAARARVLARYRDYPSGGVFTNLPADTVWQWTALTPDELLQVRYIDWDYWLEVTGGSRRPVDAIPRIGSSPIYQAIAASIAAGTLPPEIILVGRPGGEDLTVLEGHIRLTAMAMARRHLPSEIRVLIGSSPTMNK